MTLVKLCGLNDSAAVAAAVTAGADLIGFVFVPASPRAVTPARAAELAAEAGSVPRVGLFVDPTDTEVATVLAALRLDWLQLHGAESLARCADLRTRFGVPVLKAVPIAHAHDLEVAARYAPVAEMLLLDAPAPSGGTLPGGNARTFDWSVLRGWAAPRPWLLAGGLTPESVAQAIRRTGAPGVDVSSGIESARGSKDPVRIAAFVAAARAA